MHEFSYLGDGEFIVFKMCSYYLQCILVDDICCGIASEPFYDYAEMFWGYAQLFCIISHIAMCTGLTLFQHISELLVNSKTAI